MAAEGAGGSELTQLVADHILLDIDGHVLAAVVDGDGVKMVELRLQVLRTFFSFFAFISSTRFRSSGATYGPFLMDLLILTCLLTSRCGA